MLKIGEFSKLSKTTVKTLRYYDKIGLLKPAFVDVETSYRYYNEEQLSVIEQILAFKSVGLANEDILKILHEKAPLDEILSAQKEELIFLRDETEKRIEGIEKLLSQEKEQDYIPAIKTIEEHIVFCSRTYISDISHIRAFILASMQELKRTNPEVCYPEPDYCCVIYPGESFRSNDIFIEYVQSVDRMGTDTPAIKFKTLEKTMVVSVTHCGGYESLRNAYVSAVAFALENGYEILPQARERYISGVWNCDDVKDYRTEIQLPIRKRSKK